MVVAQCNTTVNAFPYYEGFQSTNGGWFSGGTNSDWQWGTISKQIMTGKGWCTGTLQGSSYSNGENSWLQSPCFNFSGLQNPQIAFKILWETERNFDGAGFQYSINNGSTWTTLGSAADASNCLNANWFNNSSITYLGTPGWSGTIKPTSGSCVGGNGSNGWVIAKHDLAFLAGTPSVIFRFTFGAGTTCNAFEGFGVDDVLISERTANTADFIYNCSQNNIVSFVSTSSSCASSYSWDFGDPASGTDNFSTQANVDHAFSSAGSYNVTLTVNFPPNLMVTVVKKVIVLSTTTSSTNVKCFDQANGSVTVNVTGGSGNYNYLWNTSPPQTTATASSLKAGSYIVTITSPQACSTTAMVNITEPAKLENTLQVNDEKCGNKKGNIVSKVSGGTLPFSYIWSTGSTQSSVQDLRAGSYSVLVTDVNGCSVTTNATVNNTLNQLNLFLGNDTTICPGEKLILNAVSFSNYLWQDGSITNTYTVTKTGTYSVKVIDADGCSATDAIDVTVDCSDIIFPSAFTPNNDRLNDEFGAAGNVGIVKNYSLKVYSRFGDLIFNTNNVYGKWDGKIKGIEANNGTFIWVAEYQLLGKQRIQKGTITLLH